MAKTKSNGITKRYVVIHPVTIDGKRYGRGAIAELTDEQAARGLKARYINPAKDAAPAAEGDGSGSATA